MRFLLFLLAVALFLVGLHLAVLYGPVPYAVFRAQFDEANQQSLLAHLSKPALTPARYAALGAAAGFALVLSAAVAWRLGRRRFGRRLGAEVRAAARATKASWQALSPAERGVALALVVAIGAARTWFLLRYPFSADEAATCDYFVRSGPRVAAAFYALPNNHILYSLLSWPLVRGLGPVADPDLLLRLPGFGLGLMATALAYAGLARLTTWRVATLATGLFQLSPMTVQYAVVGRGYGLQAAGVQALFLAVLVLWRGRGFQRLGYAVFVAASLWGFYLVPTFLYPFLSLTGALLVALAMGGRAKLPHLVRLLTAGLGVAALAALLYLPVGLLSGWRALLHNPYVVPLSPSQFWGRFAGYYLWGTIAELWGRPGVSIPGLLVLVGSAPLLWQKMAAARRAGVLAWSGLVAPVALLMVQQVYVPARALHYVLFFAALAAALLLEAVVARCRIRPALAWLAVVAITSGYAGYRLSREALLMESGQHQISSYKRHSAWLSTRRARRVLADVNLRGLYLLYHYAYKTPHLLQVVAGFYPQTPDAGYDYLLLSRGTGLPGWARQRGAQLVAADDDSRLYHLAAPIDLGLDAGAAGGGDAGASITPRPRPPSHRPE